MRFIVELSCRHSENDWNGRMNGIDHRHSSSDGPHLPEAPSHGFWYVATQFLFGIVGLALITFAAVRLHVHEPPMTVSVGPGTISLLYLIVVVFVSRRGGLVSSVAVSLIAAFCLSYFFLPLFPSLVAKNPLDIVATVAFLITTWVIAGMVAQLTQRTLALGEANNRLRSLSASLQRAREQESARIAREIHDQLGSALTSLRWDLEGVDRALSDLSASYNPDEQKHKIAAMLRLTDQTVDTVRRIASELRPSILDDLGLVPAVEWQARQFQARTGITCRFDCSLESVDLSSEQSTAVFRILQEALTNVLRHAEATQVDIVMEQWDGSLVVTITDNGRGMTQDQKTSRSSLGLLGMQERALMVGGMVDVAGEEGKGTRVTVRTPVSSA
jgi:signal transduction histidine kinase